MAIRTLSVCSGIGGLDLGLKIAEPRIRTVCYVEREAYSAATLVARMEEQALDSAPIWDDFTTLPSGLFREGLDLVAISPPCQPWSCAGKGLGENDPRDLWSTLCRFLRETDRPALFLENVAPFVKRAFPRVLPDLSAMGYSAEWGVFSNGALGAHHERKRLVLLAYTERFKLRLEQGRGGGESREGEADLGDPCQELANAPCQLRDRGRHAGEDWGQEHSDGVQELVDPLCSGWREGCTGGGVLSEDPSERRQELANANSLGGRQIPFALRGSQKDSTPHASDSRNPFWVPDQNPENWECWPEWCWPNLERLVRGETDGLPAWVVDANTNRTDRLRAVGNGFSPPVAAVAWRELTRRIME